MDYAVSVPAPKTRSPKSEGSCSIGRRAVFNAPSTGAHGFARDKETMLPAASGGIADANLIGVLE